MRIIVNAIPLLNITTGIGRYLRELYKSIQRLHPEIEVSYFDGSRIWDQMPVSPQGGGAWTFAVNLAWQLPPMFVYMARRIAHEKSARCFYRVAKDFDIYHEAGYFPYQTPDHIKTVFTIHDLSLKILPDCHPKDRVLYFRKYFENSLTRADTIITPSEFTRQEVKHLYPHISADIYSIPQGCDKSVFFRHPQHKIDAFKVRMGLPEKYVLFAGTSDPRKNIQALFKAMSRLPASINLVCAGWSGWQAIRGSNSLPANIKKRIIFTGYISDAELALLYGGARIFVYPSFYEGFGLPVLEAMACGCPVVCANTASLPEVAGQAAILCEPYVPVCLSYAIFKIFSSDELWARFSRQSLAQAENFSWQKTAERTVQVFESIY